MKTFLLSLALVAVCEGQTSAAAQAAAAIQRGDYAAAENMLRPEVSAHPGDAWPLSLLGLALDNQKKINDAEEFHRRAVASAPASADVLNNYGSHLWMAERYGEAESVFSKALTAAPAAFNILYNLGVMATLAGDYGRARESLTAALRQQPRNVEVRYRLARAEEESQHYESAVENLAQAAKIDPARADIQKMLALTTAEIGALEDSAAAWDRYLKLQPDDDAARRERGYTAVKMGRIEEGAADLAWYLARHSDDAVAYFEMGQAEKNRDLAKAFSHFDRALELNPNYAAARSARGALYYQEGKPGAAIGDLELAVSLAPDDALSLDRLGQAYAALDRSADAVRVLTKAVALAPRDSRRALHLGRALAAAGRMEESKVMLDRFRRLGPEKKTDVPAGLVDYLSLTPGQRAADYRARVEKALRQRPSDVSAHLNYLKLLLAGGARARAEEEAKKIVALQPGPEVLTDAAQSLLAAKLYPPATALLLLAGSQETADYQLARAGPLAASGKFEEALLLTEPAANRDLLLLKSKLLDRLGRSVECDALLDQLQRECPEWHAAWSQRGAVLLGRRRFEEAQRALETAVMLGAGGRTVHENLARADEGLGQKQKADAEWRKSKRETTE